MIRGAIWTVAGGVYASKPRPAVIIQSDRFAETDSITIVPFTSDQLVEVLLRLAISPDGVNGLAGPAQLMVDKITTIRRSQAGRRIGRLGAPDLVRLERAILVFFGIA